MILSTILDVGNIMNGGTNKGQADGYNLDILKSIHNTKDNNNKSVLIYICTKVKSMDDPPTMENDLKKKYFQNVNMAGKSSIGETNGALMKMKRDLKEQNGLLKKISESKDEFYTKIEKKMKRCNELVDAIEKDFDNNTKLVDDTIHDFGIEKKDPKAKSPEEFFKVIDDFIDQCDKFTPKTEPKKVKRKHEVGAKIK